MEHHRHAEHTEHHRHTENMEHHRYTENMEHHRHTENMEHADTLNTQSITETLNTQNITDTLNTQNITDTLNTQNITGTLNTQNITDTSYKTLDTQRLQSQITSKLGINKADVCSDRATCEERIYSISPNWTNNTGAAYLGKTASFLTSDHRARRLSSKLSTLMHGNTETLMCLSM